MSALDRFRVVVGWIVVGVWVISLTADALLPDYEVPVTVHAAMMLVVGYLFGPAITGRARRNGEDSE